MEQLNKKLVFLCGFGLILIMLLLSAFNLLAYFEKPIEDKLYQRLAIVDPNIFVIGIDEESLEALGPYQTWSREIVASLIAKLNSNPDTAPAVIGVDILFAGETKPEADQALVDAAALMDNVVTASFVAFGDELTEENGSYSLSQVVRSFEEPFAALKQYVTVGFANNMADDDGVIRRSLHQVEVDGELRHGLAYEIYKKYTGEEVTPPLDGKNRFYIHYSSMPGEYYGMVGNGTSLIRVLNGEIPVETFAGGIVLIGPYAHGLMDSYDVPVTSQSKMHGVEIQANIVQALLDEDFKVEVPKAGQLIFLGVLLLLVFLLGNRFSLRTTLLVILVLAVGYVGGAFFAYTKGYILEILYPVVGLLLVGAYFIICHYLSERLRRRTITNLFKRYVAPQVVENMLSEGELAINLKGEQKDVAIMFVDIRGFTTISEKMTPEREVEMLNRYFELTTGAVFKYEGMIDKFIGDSTMAIFNAPLDNADYMFKAVCAGLKIIEDSEPFTEAIQAEYGVTVRMGVGINAGPVVVGNIGTSQRMEYTAIGDTVNVAARLESNAKPGEVLIAEDYYEVIKDRIVAEPKGAIRFKGKTHDIMVYSVLGIK